MTAARLTDGDVDPTVGAALVALGYDRDFAGPTRRLPVAASMAMPATWSMVTLDDRVGTVPHGVVLDLGATAKAVAADRCAQRVHPPPAAACSSTWEATSPPPGPAPDGGWQVLVHDDDGDPASSIALPSGAALATSSTLRRRWRRGDEILHHILDPRTGRSADPVWRTVSVAAQTCFAANTVSTAAIVRGWRALEWIRHLACPHGWSTATASSTRSAGGLRRRDGRR